MSLPVLQFVHLLASGHSGLLAESIERHAPPFTLFILLAKLRGRVSLSKLFPFSCHLDSVWVWPLSLSVSLSYSLSLSFRLLLLFFFSASHNMASLFPATKDSRQGISFLAHSLSFCRMSRFLWLCRLNSPVSDCIHDNRWKPRLTSWKSEP